MSQEGASADVVLELLELLRQLACDGVAEKYIGGKYVIQVRGCRTRMTSGGDRKGLSGMVRGHWRRC
jgi:hypothetical protein